MNKEKNRKLTPVEEARKNAFEILKKELYDKGYKEKNLTVGIVYANVMAFVLALPIVLCFAIPFTALHDTGTAVQMNLPAPVYLIALLVSMFALIVAHELIHGITWSMFTSQRWKSVSFGFIAKYLTPYCTCNEPLKKGQYLLGGLMPTIVLGILPSVVALLTGSAVLLLIGAVMILSGGGDLTIALHLLCFRARGKEVLYLDHPYQVGLVAFVK